MAAKTMKGGLNHGLRRERGGLLRERGLCGVTLRSQNLQRVPFDGFPYHNRAALSEQ